MRVKVVSDTKQEFNGVMYYLCGHYFQHKGKRLHRAVWEHHNGAIPKGYHVHHKEKDVHKNQLEDLELIKGNKHLKEHMAEPQRVEKAKQNIHKAIEAAKEWHSTDNGKEWHSARGKANWELREDIAYQCTQCHNTFHTKHMYPEGMNIFCSNSCKSKYRRLSGIDNIDRVCIYCGERFTVNKYSKIEYCSTECARKQRWNK